MLSFPSYSFCRDRRLMANPPGVSKFQEVETDMKSFYVAISRLSFVVGAVSGLLGGLRVYNNWQMGRHQIDVQVISWFGACLFLATIGFFSQRTVCCPTDLTPQKKAKSTVNIFSLKL
ncbi:DUF4134 family protein [Algoriphagus boritolerans]|uniref:DUF4134 family protein n=1 Tax=Algoriphagus boritolerans TaxID=308111 RepID=UPI002FCE17AF